MTTKKILTISVVSLGALTAIYLGIRWYVLQSAYNTTLDVETSNELIDNATSSVQDGDIIEDETTNNADSNKGTNN